jgi:hypothetical protein
MVEKFGARQKGDGATGEPLDIAGNIAHRGVTVGFLRRLTDTLSLWDKPTWWVVQHVIKPLTNDRACRLVSLDEVAPFVGPAEQFVSHAWGATWGALVAAVGEHSSLRRCVWVDIMAVNEHPGHDQDNDLHLLEDAVESMPQGTLLVWDDTAWERLNLTTVAAEERALPAEEREEKERLRKEVYETSNPMLRIWCLFELLLTVQRCKLLLVRLGHLDEEGRFEQGAQEMTNEFRGAMDVNQARATMEHDRTRILAMVENTIGATQMSDALLGSLEGCSGIMDIPSVSHAVYNDEAALKETANDTWGEYDECAWEPETTAFHFHASNGYVAPVRALLKAGADVEGQGTIDIDSPRSIATPLGEAAVEGHAEVVTLLIEAGADIEAHYHVNRATTPLMLASKRGHLDVMRVLLEAGAGVGCECVDVDGKSAVDYAKDAGCAKAVALLEVHDSGGGTRS